MVCVPCFIIPALLYLWHKFIQPYVLRYWNPWAVKDDKGNTTTEFPIKCEGGVCAWGKKAQANKESLSEPVDNNSKEPENGDQQRIKSE